MATCTSPKSRNRTRGFELGRGPSLDEIVDEMNMVAEGVQSTAAVLELGRAGRRGDADRGGSWARVLYDGRRPADLVPELMLREAKSELHGLR